MTELMDRSGFNHSMIAPFVKNSQLMLVPHNWMRVFTTEPASQWVEITDLCETIFVNPCWFSEHRVYQFPIHFGPVHGLNGQNRNFVQQVSKGDKNFKTCYWIECHRKLGNQCESILEFRLDLVHNERNKLGYFHCIEQPVITSATYRLKTSHLLLTTVRKLQKIIPAQALSYWQLKALLLQVNYKHRDEGDLHSGLFY